MAGQTVTAGTINCDGNLRINAMRIGQETTMAKIIRLVEVCQGRAPAIQRMADKVAGKFSWGVLACAAVTAVFWSSLGPVVFPQVSLSESEKTIRNVCFCRVEMSSIPCHPGPLSPLWAEMRIISLFPTPCGTMPSEKSNDRVAASKWNAVFVPLSGFIAFWCVDHVLSFFQCVWKY